MSFLQDCPRARTLPDGQQARIMEALQCSHRQGHRKGQVDSHVRFHDHVPGQIWEEKVGIAP
jgi:hypothetical protein